MIVFRSTNAPAEVCIDSTSYVTGTSTQIRQFDPFFSNTVDEYRKIPRSLLAPFFKFDEPVPNIVCPGGYRGAENFIPTIHNAIFYAGPGFCLIHETLIKYHYTTILDVTNSGDYFDELGYQYIGNNKGNVYVVIGYNRNNEVIKSNQDGSIYQKFPFRNNTTSYMRLISKPSTYYFNPDMFCFLYCLTVNVNNTTRKILSIDSVAYKDPNISYMKRRGPAYGI